MSRLWIASLLVAVGGSAAQDFEKAYAGLRLCSRDLKEACWACTALRWKGTSTEMGPLLGRRVTSVADNAEAVGKPDALLRRDASSFLARADWPFGVLSQDLRG